MLRHLLLIFVGLLKLVHTTSFLSPISVDRTTGSISVSSRQLSHRTSPLTKRLARRLVPLGAFDNSRRNNFGDEFDEDDLPIDLSSQDWRAFRAHLVHSESTDANVMAVSSRGLTEEQTNTEAFIEEDCLPESGECDLDGIGQTFGVRASSPPPSTTNKIRKHGDADLLPPRSHLRSELSTPTQFNQPRWAYDSGNLIETGAVLLGGIEQEFGFGLRQQYFHKAAILVLDHCSSTFTKGIILNRPTDFYLIDDVNPGLRWRVWFGGDVQGFESDNPDLVCLHRLDDPQAKHASIPVMNDIQWTTFDNAKRLVRAGVASPEDFWVFCGYAGWGAGQLHSELERNSWYMVATDSGTVLEQLQRNSHISEAREAGLETWTLLMNMIGREATAREYAGGFDDLMLKEWAYQNLLSIDGGGAAGPRHRPPEGFYGISSQSQPMSPYEYHMRKEPVDRVLYRAHSASRGQDITAGSLVRAAPTERSPFLLHDQELHKSVVLIVSDDERMTVGAILNRPSSKGLDIRIAARGSGNESRKVTLPLRFGGQYSIREGSEPVLWLHCNSILRAAKIGEPLGPKRNGIWKCTPDDVTTSIGQGLATPEDFFVVTGVTIWSKDHQSGVGIGGPTEGPHDGMQGEIRKGNFEAIPNNKVEDVWESLSKQKVITNGNMLRNLDYAEEAWFYGGAPHHYKDDTMWTDRLADSRDGYPSPDMHHVFQTGVKVSELSDDALRHWISVFLLGNTAHAP